MDNQAWKQQTGESALWYERFTTYRLMGVKRSYLAVYNKGRKRSARNIPESWRNKIEEHEWVERVKSWDAYQRQLQDEEFEKDRAKAREMRQTHLLALSSLLGRTIINEQELAKKAAEVTDGEHAIKKAGVGAKVIKDLAAAAALIMKESRVEFGEPTDIQQVQGKGEDGAIEVKHGITADQRSDEIATLLNIARSRETESTS